MAQLTSPSGCCVAMVELFALVGGTALFTAQPEFDHDRNVEWRAEPECDAESVSVGYVSSCAKPLCPRCVLGISSGYLEDLFFMVVD